MSQILKYGHGNAAIEIDGDMKRIIEQAIRSADRATIDLLEEETKRLASSAKGAWPVKAKNSRRSIDKFQTGLQIKPKEIVAFVSNTAPYSWAIKAGPNSTLARGKRVAQWLLWSPARKGAAKLVAKMAEKTLKGS